MAWQPIPTLFVSLALANPALLADAPPSLKVTRLGDHIYKISGIEGGYEVKVIASLGKDGVLLVDTGEREWNKELMARLKELGGGPPRIVINTHSHLEHTSGNIPLGKDVLVIGHEKLRERLQSHWFLWEEFPPEALPRITFKDSMSLHFNGEEIRLMAFPGAHDNSDIVVWFTASKLACVGALVNGHHFPSVDGRTGDATKYAEVTGKVLAALPEDVKLIPGHGEECTLAEGREFRDMLVKTTELVRSQLAQGKDLKTMQAENLLGPWKSWEISYIGVDGWLDTLASGLQGRPLKTPLYEPLYRAYKEKGPEGAVQRFHEIKGSAAADQYRWEDADAQLARIAAHLYDTGKHRASLPFFELVLSEYPKGPMASECHRYLGMLKEEIGRTEQAAACYRNALALDPKNAEAAERLRKLESSQS